MWMTILCLGITIGCFIFSDRNHKRKKEKNEIFTGKIKGLLLGIQVLALVFAVTASVQDRWLFDLRLPKNEAGEGAYTQDLYVTSDLYTGKVQVEVPERQPDSKEAEKLFEEAKKEVEETFLGDNADLEHIVSDVTAASSYADGRVKAKWEFSDYGVVENDGKIRQENVKEATLVNATVYLSCGSYEHIFEFPFQVVMEGANRPGGFMRRIQELLDGQENEASLHLPEELEGETLTWKREGDHRGEALSVLGVAALLALSCSSRLEKDRRRKQGEAALRRDYPAIVSKLALFLGAGISIPEAVARIAADYKKRYERKGKRRPGYEKILQLHHEIADGAGEKLALEHFGSKSGLKEYRKLALLLQQGQRRGNEALLSQLEQAEAEAFDLRRSLALKAGEEASTKLLFPMAGMLAIVIVILLAPALLQLEGM